MTQQTTSNTGHRPAAAMMLSLDWPDGCVSRATVRSALPQGNSGRLALRGLLSDYAYANGYAVGGRHFIRVLQPDRLRDYAFDNVPTAANLQDFVHVPTLVATIRRQTFCEKNSAIRRRREAEAEFLESLW